MTKLNLPATARLFASALPLLLAGTASLAASVHLTTANTLFSFESEDFGSGGATPLITLAGNQVLVRSSDNNPLFHYENGSFTVNPDPLPALTANFSLTALAGFELSETTVTASGTYAKQGGFIGISQQLNVIPEALLSNSVTGLTLATGNWHSSAQINLVAPTINELFVSWMPRVLGTSFDPANPALLDITEISFTATSTAIAPVTVVPLPAGIVLMISGMALIGGVSSRRKP